MTHPSPLFGNLLEDRLLRYRTVATGDTVAATLPELFLAMSRDEVRDFPALRPHQRHPWHAFLVQLAAIAQHHADRMSPFVTVTDWVAGLMALTPHDPDGAAWCLVSPPDRPAFMQPAAPDGSVAEWKNTLHAADELDMLVTSKNHDLKTRRMLKSSLEDWCFAVVSLQTQEGFLGSGNYGTSRMNGGFASRSGVGIQPPGAWGKRWSRDVGILLAHRASTADLHGFNAQQGKALLWLEPWDGTHSLTLSSLDPWYIEICRRVRLTQGNNGLLAHTTGSKVPRIAAKELNGVTGDPWMPIDLAHAKALTITHRGFDYKLTAELLLGKQYRRTLCAEVDASDAPRGLTWVAQGVTRGQGKTEGYHERRIPISNKVRQALFIRDTDDLAKRANERIHAITEVGRMVWAALTVLFNNAAKDENGKDRDASKAVTERASTFATPFETLCDQLFFEDLTAEIEADPADALTVRQAWLTQLAQRAEATLRTAFAAGPRSGQMRYQAQAAALSRLHGAMRNPKSKLPDLAAALKATTQPTEENHATA